MCLAKSPACGQNPKARLVLKYLHLRWMQGEPNFNVTHAISDRVVSFNSSAVAPRALSRICSSYNCLIFGAGILSPSFMPCSNCALREKFSALNAPSRAACAGVSRDLYDQSRMRGLAANIGRPMLSGIAFRLIGWSGIFHRSYLTVNTSLQKYQVRTGTAHPSHLL